MIIILCSLLVATVNCQLAFTWLQFQQGHCTQNTRNYYEAILNQYLCILAQTQSCIEDDFTYSRSFIQLNYFCGFIDGTRILRSEQMWRIHMKPNVYVEFFNFSLFHNQWYCDYENVKVISRNKSSTFCGSRLPWVHDAVDSYLEIIFSTQRSGVRNYSFQLQYYGAFLSDHQDVVQFVNQSPIKSMHLSDKQSTYETFHVITHGRLDILHVIALNVCSIQQVVCFDGPGMKSQPALFTYNHHSQWTCVSSTFQLVCIMSKPLVSYGNCSKTISLEFHAMRADEKDFLQLTSSYDNHDFVLSRLGGKDTTKYIFNSSKLQVLNQYYSAIQLSIYYTNVSFEHMLYEGYSCIYGGVYIVRTLQASDTEVWTRCSHSTTAHIDLKINKHNLYIVVIHYGRYSAERIEFAGDIYALKKAFVLPLSSANVRGNTVVANVSSAALRNNNNKVFIEPYLLNLRNIEHFFVNLELGKDETVFVKFDVTVPDYTVSCVSCTISYAELKFAARFYNVETLHASFERMDRVNSLFINMTSCHMYTLLMWSVYIGDLRIPDPSALYSSNMTYYRTLPSLHYDQYYAAMDGMVGAGWVKVYLTRPDDVPNYAIWRVWMETAKDMVLDVSLEVRSGLLSSVYTWDHHWHSDVYMTIDEAVIFMFVSVDRLSPMKSADDWFVIDDQFFFSLWFQRHLVYDDKIKTYGVVLAEDMSYFTFHNNHR